MRVLLINGSPHEKGCTYTALSEVAAQLEKRGVSAEIFWIGNKPIRGCIDCKSCWGKGACAFDDDVLFFALPCADFDAFVSSGAPLWEMKGCRAALTQAFSSSRLAQRAALCRMALRASGAKRIRVQDMASTLLFMTLERRFSLAPYLCEDVIRVMDEDAVRGSALSRSLYAYLLYFRDMKRAAAQLKMHRNTMEYQMRKIDALIGKPAGEKQRFLMMCTYKMLALPDER